MPIVEQSRKKTKHLFHMVYTIQNVYLYFLRIRIKRNVLLLVAKPHIFIHKQSPPSYKHFDVFALVLHIPLPR